MVPRLKPCRYSSVCFGVPGLLRQRDVEERFLRDLLERPGRVHRRRGQRAHEGRRLLHNRRHLRRDGHDLVLLDELAQPAQHVAKTLQQLAAGRMVQHRFVQDLLRGPRFVHLRGHALELLLIAPQVLPADLQQAVQRDLHHLVVEQLLAIGLGADPELAVRARQQIGLQERLDSASGRRSRPGWPCGIPPAAARRVTSLNAAGTSFWKKLTMPGICSSAISV